MRQNLDLLIRYNRRDAVPVEARTQSIQLCIKLCASAPLRGTCIPVKRSETLSYGLGVIPGLNVR